jgi:hypothetical protein
MATCLRAAPVAHGKREDRNARLCYRAPNDRSLNGTPITPGVPASADYPRVASRQLGRIGSRTIRRACLKPQSFISISHLHHPGDEAARDRPKRGRERPAGA